MNSEVNSQAPIYMWRLDDDGWMECTKEWFESHMVSGYETRIVYAHPVQQSPAVAVPLPYWPPCNPGCDPEFNGERSKGCAQLCKPARDAMLSTLTPSIEKTISDAIRHGTGFAVINADGISHVERSDVLTEQKPICKNCIGTRKEASVYHGKIDCSFCVPDSAAPAIDSNNCALNTITDNQVGKVIRAFWRRIYPYRNDYGIELPSPIPVEFMSFMATALHWIDKPQADYKAQRDELVELLGDIQAVISESRGIIGYHLNGDLALWDEFDCFQNIPAAIAKCEGGK